MFSKTNDRYYIIINKTIKEEQKMNKKTIILSGDYRINNDGTVDEYCYSHTYESNPDKWEPIYEWMKTKYKIGAQVMLVSRTDVSPNTNRNGRKTEEYFLAFDCPDGIPGNANKNITRYHGLRGTDCDISTYAHGLREITCIKYLKNGQVAVTVGPDLTINEE